MRSGVRGKCGTSGPQSIKRCCLRCWSWHGGTPEGKPQPRSCWMLIMLLLTPGPLLTLMPMLPPGLSMLPPGLLLLTPGLLLVLLSMPLLPSTSSRSA